MRPAGLRARALDLFIEPREAPRAAGSPAPCDDAPPARTPNAAAPVSYLAPAAPARPAASDPAAARERRASSPPGRARAATRMPLRAAVLGSAGEAVPVAALLANALRWGVGASTAALAVWTPDGGPAVRGGPATLAASRLAARLSARGLPAVGRGRLGWIALDDHAVAAAVAARRAAGALEVPLVAALCGPRCDVVEGLLAEQDLIVVATVEPEGPLARLAVASCACAALACAPPVPGPPRWLARSGLAGARGLPAPLRALARDLALPPEPPAGEVAW